MPKRIYSIVTSFLLTKRSYFTSIVIATSFFFLLTGFSKLDIDIIDNSIQSLQRINTATYTLLNTERINDRLLEGKQFVKWSAKPFKCYLYFIHPNKGAELVFCKDKNNNEAIYSPNGFPYLNLNLDPLGTIMRRNNHHTVYETGFQSFLNILHEIKKNSRYIFYDLGKENRKGESCRIIEIVNFNFSYSDYFMSDRETIRWLAKKNMVSDFLVSEKNGVDGLEILEKGTKLLIPNSYAKKIKIWINQENSVPVCMEFYDDKGLFERYEIQNLIINPTFMDVEFTEAIFGKNNYK